MAWVKIDDQFPDHPKIAACGPLGMALQVAALCYSGRFLTDGFIPASVAPRLMNLEGLANPEDVIQRLVNAGVWIPVDGGFQIHDYLEYQPSRAQVEAVRKKRVEAGRRGGQARSKVDSKQSAKQSAKQDAKHDAKQIASNELSNSLSKNEAKSNPVPVPIPLIKDQERDSKESKKVDARKDSAPTDSLSTPSDGLKQVAQHYEQVIGVLSPTAFERLRFWLDDVGMAPDVVCAAIDVAKDKAETPGIAYVEGVLRNWENRGVRTLADIKAREQATEPPPEQARVTKLAQRFREKAALIERLEAERGAEHATA